MIHAPIIVSNTSCSIHKGQEGGVCASARHPTCPQTYLLLHNLLAVHDVNTLWKVFQLARHTHAAEGIDALRGVSVGKRSFNAGWGFLNHHLTLYNLSVQYYSVH